MPYSGSSFRKISLLFGICCLLYVFGIVVFMNGLISSTISKSHQIMPHDLLRKCSLVTSEEICSFQTKIFPKFHSYRKPRVIIMIIDALRADFVPSIKHNKNLNVSMPFTESLIKNGSGLSYMSQGFAPTVTLPRVKTLVTGTVSNFIDILLNFNAVELYDDNILKQASLVGMKSIFYGDNTWLKLFPNIFTRSEGTHSFFVSDFKEVDFNVSRHIEQEMNNKDWDILILHFLGVDHIGHAYGPFSEYIPLKLIEMDDIIKYMYKKSHDIPSLIVVCGDHGMTKSGSHGGITQDELLTPLIFISTTNHHAHLKNNMKTDQLDFAPTISAILGLPIPANSFGNIIADALKFIGFSNEEILHAVFFNFLQIFNIYEEYFPSKIEYFDFAGETIENHYKLLARNITLNNFDYTKLLKSYEMLLSNLKKDLLSVLSGYNNVLLLSGLIIMWLSVLISLYIFLLYNYNTGVLFKISNRQVTLLILSSILLVAIFIRIYVYYMYIIITTFSVFLTLFMQQIYLKYSDEKRFVMPTGKISLFFLLFHALSLFSSSYIEEEHQTWYYFTSSVLILICCKRLYLLFKIQLINMKTINNLKLFWNECSRTLLLTLVILISHRIFSKWNQVGNKWQHLPDISDWLNEKENMLYLRTLVILSQFILMFYFKNELEKLNFVLFVTGLLLIVLQKFDIQYLPHSTGFIERVLIPQIIYVLLIFMIFFSFLQIYSFSNLSQGCKIERFTANFISVWILLIEVIARAHNVPLVVFVLIQEYFLSRIIWSHEFSIISKTVCYFIMAMSSYSYYGNSNNLSTIDVFTGYAGMQSYIPLLVGFLLTCNTFSTLILWLLLFFYRMMHFNCGFENSVVQAKFVFLHLFNYKLIILALYCSVTFIMRYHLFIYSVFLPKLFYELCHVILFSMIYLFITLVLD